MAVFDTTIVENIRKSVGNVTMYVNGGQQVVRKKAAVVKDRKSSAQLQQRERFKVVAALWPYIKPVAGRCFCPGTVRKAWNRFLRVNVSRVLVNGEQTDEENWGRLLVAEGPLVVPDMVAEIGVENREVVFRFPAPLLVERNARGLLKIDAKLLGLGADEVRNHPLGNDRVAARSEPGAEKDLLHVAAAHLLLVDEVGRRTFPRDDALN